MDDVAVDTETRWALKVVGLDLSLTSTGVAIADEATNHSAYTLRPKARGHERLAYLVRQVMVEASDADLVVVEGPSYGSKGSAFHQLAGLWWLITQELWDESIPYAQIPPPTLKKFATGAGNANKDAVLLATARRFPSFSGDNNAADALWLAAAGAQHLGYPLVQVPESHRTALAKVEWPVLNGDTK